jgi:hypothetical protein
MEFCERELEANPDDVSCLSTVTALAVAQGGEFEQGRWAQLYRLKEMLLETTLFAAMLLEVAGSPDSREFSEFIKATGSRKGIAPHLREIAQQGGKLLAEWSRSVSTLLAH